MIDSSGRWLLAILACLILLSITALERGTARHFLIVYAGNVLIIAIAALLALTAALGRLPW